MGTVCLLNGWTFEKTGAEDIPRVWVISSRFFLIDCMS